MKQLRISWLSAAGKRRTTLCTTCLAKQSAQRDRRGAGDASALEKRRRIKTDGVLRRPSLGQSAWWAGIRG